MLVASSSRIAPALSAVPRLDAGAMAPLVPDGLLDRLAEVPDPRDPRGVRYRLASLLAIGVCAMTASGHDSLAAIAEWVRPTDKTKEISTLRLLLQNDDDSDLVTVQSKAERNRLANAKAEVLDGLLAELEEQVHNAGPATELRARLDLLNASIGQQTSSVGQRTAERTDLIRDLAHADRLVGAAQRSIDEADVLKSRFQLLLEQHTSDLQRLEMVAEAGTLLGYFNPGQCVFCGADSEHQHLNDDCAEDTTYFGESVLSEQRKTTALRDDLRDTLVELGAQRTELSERRDRFVAQASEIRAQMRRLDSILALIKEVSTNCLSLVRR